LSGESGALNIYVSSSTIPERSRGTRAHVTRAQAILAKPGHVFLSGSVLLTWDIKRCDTELDGSYNLVLVSNNAYYENLFVYGAMSDTNYRLTS